MDCRALILEGYAHQVAGIRSSPRFFPPASEHEIRDVAARMPFSTPAGLLALLRQTNGVLDVLEVSPGVLVENLWLVWPVGELLDANREDVEVIRFAPAGADGITYVMRRDVPGVFAWYPIGREFAPLADSLESFLPRPAAGEISV